MSSGGWALSLLFALVDGLISMTGGEIGGVEVVPIWRRGDDL